MIVKNRIERKERHWIPFFLILSFSIITIYFIYNNSSIRIKTNIPFGHNGFLYLFDVKLYFIIISLVYNYGNIYQVFLLFYSLSIPQFLFSLYYILIGYDNQIEKDLFYSYFLLFLFFLVLCRILFDKRNNNISNNINDKNNINYKGLFLYIFIFLFLLSCLTNTIGLLNSNIIFIDKILSGFLLSFSCYYFLFQVLNVSLGDSLQLFHFLNNIDNNIIIVLFFTMIIISLFLKNDNEYYKFLSPLLYLLSILAPVYGIIYEYKFLFNSNRKNWANYNFEKEKDMNNDNINSLISEITITKSIKWNKTSFCIDILRFFVIIFFQICFFYLSDNYNFYFDENDESEYKINDAFLFFVFAVFLFVIGKILLFWMKLINMTYFFLERNSINSK